MMIVSCRNAHNLKRIEAERPHLQDLPQRRTTDFEEVVVGVMRTGGFTLRKVFYSVPSRLIGHQLRVRLFDDRLDVFVGGTYLMTLTRGRSIRTVATARSLITGTSFIPSVRSRRRYCGSSIETSSSRSWKQACETMVDILALAHERICERELAEQLARTLYAGELPDMAELRKHFAPDPATLPVVSVHLASLSGYEALVAGHAGERA